ncbi:siderophore-interacting protein [Aeromicrobium sp. 179-A 4D2 NHS]|uniref:siderophore-interacting protein n=1 Tax=Aeromicrobium sp. 179-A 4D2 NHS TaxID=3142375 RepID=UPI0039A0C078
MGSFALVPLRGRPLLRLQVLRSERVAPHYQRVTVGGDAITGFTASGWGQWLRLVLPSANPSSLDDLPDRVTPLQRLRYLTLDRDERPVLRDYAVRRFRPIGRQGPELDIDFVLHGTDAPASAWAQSCGPGDRLAAVDEGQAFDRSRGSDHVLLVADETGVPTVAGVLASLPEDATGTAVLEVPSIDDAGELDHPPGVELVWLSRDEDDPPGRVALETAETVVFDRSRVHAFVAGEQSLARRLRRHLLSREVPRVRISAAGYWRRAR